MAIVAGWIAVNLFFSPGAFRIDDTNIVAIAHQVSRDPLHPYSFSINWLGRVDRAFDILANPPLVPAWLALWARFAGWSEVSLHLAMIPFSVLALVAFASMARSFGWSRAGAMTLLLCSPAFVLGSLVVMPDVAMFSLLVAAVAFSLAIARGESSAAVLVAASASAALAPLAKYNGVLVIPLLGFLVWRNASSRRKLLIPLAFSGIGIGLWSVYTWAVYGKVHILQIAAFEQGTKVDHAPFAVMLITALGLAVLPFSGIIVTSSNGWRRHVAITVVAGVAGGAYSLFIMGENARVSLFFALGAAITGAAAHQIFSRWGRDDNMGFLLIWITLGVLLQLRVLFVAPRYFLSVLAPILLLLGPPFLSRGRLILTLNVLLVLSVAVGDRMQADIARRAVLEIVKLPHNRIFFAGHWGFQYYAEKAGGLSVDGSNPSLEKRDLFLYARDPMPLPDPPHPMVARGSRILRRSFDFEVRWPLLTVSCDAGANFYGPHVGSCRDRSLVLPFGLATGSRQEFVVFSAEPVTETKSWPGK